VRRRLQAVLTLAAGTALSLTACGPPTQGEEIRAAQSSCPHGLQAIKFENDGTGNIERVVCK
jgi:hypothetical protein